jgi:type I restriction enzyme, S subunit
VERQLETVALQYTDTLAPSAFPDEEFAHFSLPAYDSGQNPKIEIGKGILSNKTVIADDAILLSKLNPEIKRVWLTPRPNGLRQVSSTEFLAYTPNHGFGKSWLYCLFDSQPFRETLVGMVTGTSKSHQRVSPKALALLSVVTAPEVLHVAFERIAAPLLLKAAQNRNGSLTLAATRDLLLPKLMSGEIRLAAAEAMAGAAT